MEHQLQRVQAFLTKIDEEPEAKAKFDALAENNDLDGFEKWAQEMGCDLETLRSLAAPPEGELSDAELDQVSGGAGWLIRQSGSLRPMAGSPQVDGVRVLLSRVGARWPLVQQDRVMRPPSEWTPR